MMKIIHGDNQLASRLFLHNIKEQAKSDGAEVVSLTGGNIELTTVIQAVESGGLYGSLRLVVIEELFSGKASLVKNEIVRYLRQDSPQCVVIWEPKRVDSRKLKRIEALIKEFKVDVKIFKFLESLRPGGQRLFLPLWEEMRKNEPVELVFFMMVRQVRQLIGYVSDPSGFAGPSWLKGKLERQSREFGLVRLLGLHGQLYEIEYKTKTGMSSLPLATRLEILLLSI